MGRSYCLKSLLAVAAVAILLVLTWNKASQIVLEVSNAQTIKGQGQPGRVEKYTDELKYKYLNDIRMETEMYDIKSQTVTTSDDFMTTQTPITTETDTIQNLSDYSSPDQTISFATSSSSTSEANPGTISASTALGGSNEITSEYHSSNKPSEQMHVAFLKVHKTGSSTVQNIFLRFGDSRNLTFILAHDDKMKAETKYPNMISYSNSLTENNIVPPPEGRHYEILCCHVIYNRQQFEKFLPSDTAYIGLVREPISRLESAFRYFNLFPNISLSNFSKNPLLYDRGKSMSNNRMAFEFGYSLNLFPTSKVKPHNLQDEIMKYTDKIMNEFDLIMINEMMDESLVLLKRTLNWQMKDIMYMKQLVARQETRRFTDSDIINLKSYLYLDYALYQAALGKFEEKVDSLGDDFKDEVGHFKDEKTKVQGFCERRGLDGNVLSLNESRWESGYNITLDDCALFTKFEIKFIQDIRMKQYGRLGI